MSLSRTDRTVGGMLRLWGALATALITFSVHSAVVPVKSTGDDRVRHAAYSSEQVYVLYAVVGYQIDLQFEDGESFVGLAAGDMEALSFVSQGNHLFIKPKANVVGTNLTVLTNRRQYQFEYSANTRHVDQDASEVMYALRFSYPPLVVKPNASDLARQADVALAQGPATRPHNIDYWFCGAPSIKPTAAWDDGVHTWLTFDAHAELPAIFVRNEDGTESLLNFSVEQGALVIQRVAHRFILRRSQLTGCVINAGFTGSGSRLSTNTISPDVTRSTRSVDTRSTP